jgi:hypothetical protein
MRNADLEERKFAFFNPHSEIRNRYGVFLFLVSALFLLSVLLSLVFPEDFAPVPSGSGPGPPVGAMFELSILSLLTVVSVSERPAFTLVLAFPPQALQKAAMVNKARIVRVRRIDSPPRFFKGFFCAHSLPQLINSTHLYYSSSSGATPK